MRKKLATTKQWLSDYRYKAGEEKTCREDDGEPSKASAWMNPKKCGGKAWKTIGEEAANKRRYTPKSHEVEQFSASTLVFLLNNWWCDADCCIFLCIIWWKMPGQSRWGDQKLRKFFNLQKLWMGKLWKFVMSSYGKSLSNLKGLR